MITFQNIPWKVPQQNPLTSLCNWSWLLGVLAARGSELPPAPGNSLHPSEATFLGTTWEPVLFLRGQASANGNWVIQKPGSLASLEPLTVQSSQGGEVQGRLQLNPPLCLALPPGLACVPHSLSGLKRELSFSVPTEQHSPISSSVSTRPNQGNSDLIELRAV